jgi:hypothetical protein
MVKNVKEHLQHFGTLHAQYDFTAIPIGEDDKKNMLGRALKASPFYNVIRTPLSRLRQRRELRAWDGHSVPVPHLVKQRTLIEHAERYGLRVLVETGTHRGDMVEGMKGRFDQIFTIELSDRLYRLCKERFQRAKHIHVIHGDSGEMLEELVPRLHQPTLFWLDGHYSGSKTAKGSKETPIAEELRHIMLGMKPSFVVIVDDARCFGNDPSYPTFDEVRALVQSMRHCEVTVDKDSIRIIS